MAKPHVKTPPARSARLAGLAPRTVAMLADAARLIDRFDYDGAERALTGALVLAPSHPETLRLQGLVHHRRGRLAEAEDNYRRALSTSPDDPDLLGQLGELRADRGDLDGGFALLERATTLAPNSAAAWLKRGILFDKQVRHDEALAAGRRVIALDPAERLGHLLVARNLHALGDIEGTAAQYRTLIRLGGPRAYQAWFSLVDLKTIRLDAKEVAALERAAQDPALGDNARAPLQFALGKVYEDAGRHADAYRALTRANAIVRRGIQWDAGAFNREIDATSRLFSGTVAQSAAPIGEEVIFIVGLPRSGTTLIEQIVATHPDVEGASELPDLGIVLSQESKRRNLSHVAWAAQATPADWERLGREYLERTARWRTERPRFTDKLPNNWALIGHARAMLPRAKFVAMQRDPVETCWSCYKQMFAPNLVRYAYDFGDLAAYWRDYDRLCRFWAERYPDSVRVQGYETLLAEPETETRALLDFCGLSFYEPCLRSHESQRGVRTVSSAQVREPLRRSTARTGHYGALLDPLRAALGVAT